jgi:hypothetical protein
MSEQNDTGRGECCAKCENDDSTVGIMFYHYNDELVCDQCYFWLRHGYVYVEGVGFIEDNPLQPGDNRL